VTRYVPNETIDTWSAAKQPSLTYPGGEPIVVGDQVDFGLDPRQIGIDPVEGPWVGTVVGIVLASGQVLIDTFCNSIDSYPPSDLKLLHRPTEAEKAAERDAIARSAASAAELKARAEEKP